MHPTFLDRCYFVLDRLYFFLQVVYLFILFKKISKYFYNFTNYYRCERMYIYQLHQFVSKYHFACVMCLLTNFLLVSSYFCRRSSISAGQGPLPCPQHIFFSLSLPEHLSSFDIFVASNFSGNSLSLSDSGTHKFLDARFFNDFR